MLNCKSVSAWGHDFSTNAELAFNKRAGWQICIWFLQSSERKMWIANTGKKTPHQRIQSLRTWGEQFLTKFLTAFFRHFPKKGLHSPKNSSSISQNFL